MSNSSSSSSSSSVASSPIGAALQSGKFKTVMCEHIAKQGVCPRGFSCGFAHSHSEMIAARESDPKYKSSLCQTYKNTGSCSKAKIPN